jgi:hypothetical protein
MKQSCLSLKMNLMSNMFYLQASGTHVRITDLFGYE